MGRRFAAIVLAGGLALAGCGGAGSGGAGGSGTAGGGGASGGPIKVGMVLTLTGPFAPLGAGDKAAAEQEVKRINGSGGVLGRQIELTIVDDKTDVTQSVTEYNKLASDTSYVAVMSSTNVSGSAAIGPSAIRTKTPTLALSPVSAYADGSNPYAFNVVATPDIYAQKLAEYFAATGVKSLAIAYSGDDVYGKTGGEATVAALAKVGVNVVLNESFDPSATDFTPLVTKVKNAKPQGLLIWAAGPAPVIITKQMQGSGIQLYGTGANATSLFTEPAGAAAEGMIVASNIAVAGAELPPGPLKDEVDSFTGPWLAANDDVYPPQFAFDGVAAVRVLKAAIEKAGSTDREAIRNALETLDLLTPVGRYTYSKTNHVGLTPDSIAIVQVKNGGFVATDFTKKQFATNLPK